MARDQPGRSDQQDPRPERGSRTAIGRPRVCRASVGSDVSRPAPGRGAGAKGDEGSSEKASDQSSDGSGLWSWSVPTGPPGPWDPLYLSRARRREDSAAEAGTARWTAAQP